VYKYIEAQKCQPRETHDAQKIYNHDCGGYLQTNLEEKVGKN